MIRIKTIAAVLLTVAINVGFSSANPTVSEQIRREIASTPYTGIWDWIDAEIRPDGSVILRGDVLQPSSKSDAEFRIRRIESVSKVINEIHVLPLSNFDNEIRISVYWRLFNSNSPLSSYALGANPSIHIIVENGKVTLKGIVSNAMDKQLAGVAANGVFGVMNVDNQLRLESEL
jgi:osmotically-inducible protein OsmY